MEMKEIYYCHEILMRAGEFQTNKEKECDKLFKDPRTRELIVEEKERLKNMKDNLEQEIVENSHYLAVNEANNKILAAIDYDVLRKTHSKEIIRHAVETIANHAEHFLQEDVLKVVESCEVFEKGSDTREALDQSYDCIMFGDC